MNYSGKKKVLVIAYILEAERKKLKITYIYQKLIYLSDTTCPGLSYHKSGHCVKYLFIGNLFQR